MNHSEYQTYWGFHRANLHFFNSPLCQTVVIIGFLFHKVMNMTPCQVYKNNGFVNK